MSTSPVSGSISTSQIAQPLGNTGSCISLSVTTASPSARSSGSATRSQPRRRARGSRSCGWCRGATNRPSANVDLVGRRRRARRAAIRLPLSIRSAAALENTVAAWRIERPECEPPPTFTTSVSPRMMLTFSTGTARRSDTTCAKLVSWPCPLGWVPMTTSTRPSGRTVISRLLLRRADRGFDVIGEAAAEQLAALPGVAPARREAVPVGDLACARSMFSS